MTKRPDPRTPADTQPFGLPHVELPDDVDRVPPEDDVAAVEETGPKESTNIKLRFAERTALALRETHPEAVLETVLYRDEWTVTVRPEKLLEVMTFLRDQWHYKMCHDVSSVDLYPTEPRFMAVYHLLNLDRATRFRVKAPLSGENPEIDSVTGLWPGANFMEREVYDLMGIRFRGHPDLRRILMPEDWEGHPLRKDLPVAGTAMGVDTLKN